MIRTYPLPPDYTERLSALDNYLLQIRGWVARISPDRKAIILFSGGLDSVVLAAKLIVEAQLTVFPLHIIRGQSNLAGERSSIAYYGALFAQRFGHRFAPVQDLSITLPPEQIRNALTSYVNDNGYPCRDNLFCLYGIQYAIALERTQGTVRDIFTSAIPGGAFPHDTLLALRSSTVLACSSTPYTDWNITAPNIDPRLHGDAGASTKAHLVSWAAGQNIPLSHTHTCIIRGDVHCGRCSFCEKRRKAFAAAGVMDETIYAD